MAGDLINGNVTLAELIEGFVLLHVGSGKTIPSVERTDVIFYAKRSIQEFNYETYYTQEGFTPPAINDPVVVPKLAEDYLHTSIAYYILSDKQNANPNVLQKLIAEKAEKLRQAKSRLVFTNFN
jgi:hypothetical protein